jgi:prepilin-type N-terminal cleavage/methylation domain-containing protein
MNERGFTLLEVLVVIIIVGVLAAVAMPNFFKAIQSSYATEGLNTIGIINRAMNACLLTRLPNACANFDALGMTNPGTSPGSHFTYSITGYDITLEYSIQATRNTLDGGNGSDYINLFKNSSLGYIKSGTGAFESIK